MPRNAAGLEIVKTKTFSKRVDIFPKVCYNIITGMIQSPLVKRTDAKVQNT